MEHTTSLNWREREHKYRAFVAELSDAELLRQARISWFQGLMNDPMWREDVLMLAIQCQECERRGLKAQFEALEGDMRADLERQGRRPLRSTSPASTPLQGTGARR